MKCAELLKMLHTWSAICKISLVIVTLLQTVFFILLIHNYAGEGKSFVASALLGIFLVILCGFTFYLSWNRTKNCIWLYWFQYSVVEWIPNVTMIFVAVADSKLDEHSFWKINTVKAVLCLTPCMFVMMLYSFKKDVPEQKNAFLQKMMILTTFDLFDSVEMLEFIFDSKPNNWLPVLVLVLACLISLTPVLPLFELSRRKVHSCPADGKYNVMSEVVGTIINACYLCVRLYIWVKTSYHVSVVFFFKNILLGFRGIVEVVHYVRYIRNRGRLTSCEDTSSQFSDNLSVQDSLRLMISGAV